MENLLASNSFNSYPYSSNFPPNSCNSSPPSKTEQENVDDNDTFVWEKLESASVVIRELEIQLDRTVDDVNELQIDWNEKLKFFENTMGNAIEKSRPFYECIDHWRPYYETKEKLFNLHQEHQTILLDFERATTQYETAQKRVDISRELFYSRGGPNYLKRLNDDIDRLNYAELDFYQIKYDLDTINRNISEISAEFHFLKQDLELNVRKSKPYFDARVKFANDLDEKTDLIRCLQEEIEKKKIEYNSLLMSSSSRPS